MKAKISETVCNDMGKISKIPYGREIDDVIASLKETIEQRAC